MAGFRFLIAAPIVGLLLLAAWHDLATRTIPDAIAIAIAALGTLQRLGSGLLPFAVSLAVALGFGLFLVVLHARGWFGGGDVKLATAICLGLSAAATYRFVVITATAGGVLAMLHLALRIALRRAPVHPPRRATAPCARIYWAERWRIARHGPLPYAVALASGGICAVLGAGGG